MKYIYYLLLLLLSITSKAQTSPWSFGIGTSGTLRILYFQNDNLTNEEKSEAINLNAVKPSYHFQLGYNLKNRSTKISWTIGTSLSLIRYGIKKYEVPIGFHNSTPQYPLIKRVVEQKEASLFLDGNFNKNFLWAKSIFAKASVIYNYHNYSLRVSSYDLLGNKYFPGKVYSDAFISHKVDFKLSFGLNYFLFNNKITLKPYTSIFFHPYKVSGFQYIYFEKDTYGILTDFGIMVNYNFNFKKQ